MTNYVGIPAKGMAERKEPTDFVLSFEGPRGGVRNETISSDAAAKLAYDILTTIAKENT